jgi:predicted PurR-regulated permease PerM
MIARSSRRIHAPTPRVALVIFTAIVIGLLLYLGRGALGPFILGLILVYILDPAVQLLVRRGFPRGLSVLLVYIVAAFLLIEGLTLLLRPLVAQVGVFIQSLPEFTASLERQLDDLAALYDRLQLPDPLRSAIDGAVADLGRSAGGFDPTGLLPIVRSVAGLFGAALGFLLIPVWAFYILKDRNQLVAGIDRALPAGWRTDTWAVLRIVERVMGRYLRAQLVLGLIVGGATFLGLLLLGFVVDARFLQFALLLAVVAGLFELLPVIGPILSMVPTLLLALTISPQAVLAVFLLYLVVQQVENNLLVPKIQGNAIDLHPSVVIFALVVGGAIAGLLGAIFSLPITAAARDVFRYLFRRLSDDDPYIPPAVAPEVPPREELERLDAAETGSAAVSADGTGADVPAEPPEISVGTADAVDPPPGKVHR